MAFAFEYVGVRFDAAFQDHRFFGRIVSGEIRKGDSVVVQTSGGEQIVVVSNFWDDMHHWLGMPFYDVVDKASVPNPFCVCVHGLSADVALCCPSVLRSPDW